MRYEYGEGDETVERDGGGGGDAYQTMNLTPKLKSIVKIKTALKMKSIVKIKKALK